MMRSLRCLLSACAILLAPGMPAAAQVVVVDEGTFSLLRDSARVGREDFSIRRALANEGGYVAQGNVLRGEGRASVALSTDSTGLPLRFQLERSVGGRVAESLSGEYRRGLWSGRTVRGGVESGREFRLPDDVLAAADGVAHETWFLLRFGQRTGVRLLEPGALTLRPVHVEAAGADTVALGFASIPAVRWLVRIGVGGPVEREAWTDAQGRLLRVRFPAEGLDAVRDEAPR